MKPEPPATVPQFALERFPKRPFCASAKDSPRRVRSLAQALRYPYIQPNPPGVLCWLVFDIDRSQAVWAADDALLPPPTFVVARKDTDASAHFWYGLRLPVKLDPNGFAHSTRFARAIVAAMCAKLGADSAFTASLAKTPHHAEWRTMSSSRLYSLRELFDWLPIVPAPPRHRDNDADTTGRNVWLFRELTSWAYRQAREAQNANALLADCTSHLANLNGQLADPFPSSDPELRSIAKSVARYAWERRAKHASRFIARQRWRSSRAVAARRDRSSRLRAHLLDLVEEAELHG